MTYGATPTVPRDPDAGLPAAQRAIRKRGVHPTGAFVPFPTREVEGSLVQRFEAQVRRAPDRPAVRTRRHALTYATLDAAANRIAHAILNRCGEGEEAIALLLGHDAPAVAAMLGVLKAGKLYAPLDPSYPPERLRYVLGDSTARLLLTEGGHLDLARSLAGDAVQVMDVEGLDDPATSPGPGSGPDTLACLLYTSGSTGRPKGSTQTHRNLLHEAMHYTNAGRFCADDRFLLVSSMSFADSVRTIYSALLNGAALCPFDLRAEGLTPLTGWMVEQGITVYRSVATTFRHLVRTLTGEEHFHALRLIYLGAETVYPSDVEAYRRHFPGHTVLVNRLGTTETLTFRACFLDHDTPVPAGGVPVGYAVPDKEVLLLDERGLPVAAGEIGEIAVRSRYLSPGYWRQPELTRAAFTVDPEDPNIRVYRTGDLGRLRPEGCLEHLGRKDFQVKVRGHRVEPVEIEAALLAQGAIREAVVVARRRGDDDTLVAYLVPAARPAPGPAALRRGLVGRLPDHMVPSVYVVLDALPLLPSGKVNRRALPEPPASRPELDTPFIAPRNPLEETLVRIWVEVLGLDQVGVDDDFLELGGDSLMATRIIARVTDRFDVTFPVRLLWAAPTVGRMAEVLVATGAAGPGDGVPAGQ